MTYAFGSREWLDNLFRQAAANRPRLMGPLDPRSVALAQAAHGAAAGQPGYGRAQVPPPFAPHHRNPDGTWDAPLATRDNIGGTSVDPEGPVWPRWKQAPPPGEHGDFLSGEPFLDIDEISGKAEFYPPGKPLRDGNVNGNPASRQRTGDTPAGNSWRRRLLTGRGKPNNSRNSGPGQPGYPALLQHVGAQPIARPAPSPSIARQPTPDQPAFWAVRPPRSGNGQWASRYPFYMVDGETSRALLPLWQSDRPFPSPDVFPPARNGQPAGDGVPNIFQRGAPGNPLNDYLWPYFGL